MGAGRKTQEDPKKHGVAQWRKSEWMCNCFLVEAGLVAPDSVSWRSKIVAPISIMTEKGNW